jgi:ferredoxin
MATMITDQCTSCGACVDECPNEAISLGPDGFQYAIAPDKCTECVGHHGAPMCAEVCPADCCLPDPSRVETEAELFERARRLHPGRADALVLSPKTSRFRPGG